MKVFSGFPAGKVEVTPLPNLFFSELLPAIDDLAELQVTLRIFWLLAHSKSPSVRMSDLRADRALMQAMALNHEPEESLARALDRATERGTLLRHDAPVAGKASGDALYFLNTESGRRAFAKMSPAELPRQATREPASVAERPNIFALYEKNIGLLTPLIAEDLKEAEQTYPAEWIADALKIAVENNKRSWSYARKILERWKTEGRGEKAKSKAWYGDKYGKLVKR